MTLTQASEGGLKISNAGSNGQFLQKQSGATGGLTWATVSTTPEGTAILSTGESGTTKFLRVDGDGTCSWQVPPDNNTQVGGSTSVTFNNSVAAGFGGSNNLSISHDGSDALIKTITGDLNLQALGGTSDDVLIAANDDFEVKVAASEKAIYAHGNEGVELYYNGLQTFETLEYGAKVKRTTGGSTLLYVEGCEGNSAAINLWADDGDGNVGIGVDPIKKLHVKGLDVALRIESTAATGRIGMEFYDTAAQKGFFGYPSTSNNHMSIQQNEAADLYLYVNGGERFRINSSGYIGHHDSNIVTNGFGFHGWSGQTQILHSQGLAIYRAGDAWGGSLQLASSRGSYASPSASSNGDRSGGIYFCAHDGSDLNSYTAAIESYITDTVASNDTPGYLSLQTVADGSNQLSERFRIESNGNVYINDGDLVIGTGGHGIDFSAQTATSASGAATGSSPAEVLDHYEEGTFTPTAGVGSLTVEIATYTKIGRLVTFQIYGTFGSSSSGTGEYLQGFPFAGISTSPSTYYSISVHSDTTSSTGPMGQFEATSGKMYFKDSSNNGFNGGDMSGHFVNVAGFYYSS